MTAFKIIKVRPAEVKLLPDGKFAPASRDG
jgi:hypothetical protein